MGMGAGLDNQEGENILTRYTYSFYEHKIFLRSIKVAFAIMNLEVIDYKITRLNKNFIQMIRGEQN